MAGSGAELDPINLRADPTDPKIVASNAANARYWRQAQQAAERKALIKPDMPPVNVMAITSPTPRRSTGARLRRRGPIGRAIDRRRSRYPRLPRPPAERAMKLPLKFRRRWWAFYGLHPKPSTLPEQHAEHVQAWLNRPDGWRVAHAEERRRQRGRRHQDHGHGARRR